MPDKTQVKNGINGFAKELTEKIKSGEIKMRPKAYFVIGNVLAIGGIVISASLGTLLTSFLIHRYKMYKLMETTMFGGIKNPGFLMRGRMFLYNFPWWALLIALASVVGGIYLMRKFESGYKTDFTFLIVLTLFIVVITGIVLDRSGIHDVAMHHKPFDKFYPMQHREDMIRGARNYNPPEVGQRMYLLNGRIK
jgi:cytochrome b subunit of formate dehydrogenase